MRLVVHELTGTGLVQELTPNENMILGAVRPHIYRHQWPAGSLKVQVLDASDTLLAESETVDIADIGTQNYFHGNVRFFINLGLQKDTLYKFKIVGLNGYSFDESAYCGVCSDHDLRKYPASYSPNDGTHAALDLEVWTRSTR